MEPMRLPAEVVLLAEKTQTARPLAFVAEVELRLTEPTLRLLEASQGACGILKVTFAGVPLVVI